MFGVRRIFGAETAAAGEKAAHYVSRCGLHRPFQAGTFFDLLVEDALELGSTDIHIIPDNNELRIRLRVDGALRDFYNLEARSGKFLIGRVKVLAGMDILVFDAPQDGAGTAQLAGKEIPFRASTMPVRAVGENQERIVVRLYVRREFQLDALGLDTSSLGHWRALLREPQGLLVLTGPANAGKTTMIYSSLLEIGRESRGERNIATVEDPVEFPVEGLSQSQVNHDEDFGFPEALRALMRQDPQVIMIGEIRDPETAKIAIEASLTGHLVMTTVHATKATGVFTRLLSLGIDPVRSASAVLAVMNQRLLRLTCNGCAAPDQPHPDFLRRLPPEIIARANFKRGAGCPLCGGTGYRGRTAAVELLVMDAAMRSAVCAGTVTQELYDQAIEAGLTTIWQNALRLVLDGRIPLEDAVRAIGQE